ncbi:hypothetical protein J6590_024882 [Homalodisca vitripennis]|nr:hypothetical protein J6590_024882 [Homalodisca vitripennis]
MDCSVSGVQLEPDTTCHPGPSNQLIQPLTCSGNDGVNLPVSTIDKHKPHWWLGPDKPHWWPGVPVAEWFTELGFGSQIELEQVQIIRVTVTLDINTSSLCTVNTLLLVLFNEIPNGDVLHEDGQNAPRMRSYTHTHTHTHTHARTHTHAHARTHTHAHARARTRTHAHARARTRAHTI